MDIERGEELWTPEDRGHGCLTLWGGMMEVYESVVPFKRTVSAWSG